MQHRRSASRQYGRRLGALLVFSATVGTLVTVAGGDGAGVSSRPAGPVPVDPPGVFDGLSRASSSLELAFAVRGKVAELSVSPGQQVKTGQILMQLDDAVQRQMVALAKHKADNDTQVRGAQKTLELREEDFRLLQEADQKHSASDSDIRTRRLQRDLAQINVEAEIRTSEENSIGLAREQAMLDQMRVVSPIDGVVVDVYKRPGETVDELTKVLLVVSADPLWVEVSVPAAVATSIAVGDGATVAWEDLPETAAVKGKVIYKSPVSDPGSRKILVRIEAPNPDGLPTGLHGQARFSRAGGPAGKQEVPDPAAKSAGKADRGT